MNKANFFFYCYSNDFQQQKIPDGFENVLLKLGPIYEPFKICKAHASPIRFEWVALENVIIKSVSDPFIF